MKFYISIIVFLSFSSNLSAQDWERRHKFAKSYFGLSNFIIPSLEDGNFLNSNGGIQQFKRSGFLSPSVNIGATHFWGYADLYVSINTANIKFGDDALKNDFRIGTFTGLRVYPLASRENSIRPYLGYKFSPFSYSQTNLLEQNYKFTQTKSVFDIGFGIQLPNFYLTLEYSRVANIAFNTYLSRNVATTDKFPAQLFQIGLNYTVETTKSADTEANRIFNKLFSNSNKYGFFFGAGPSSVFPLLSSNYITDIYTFLDDKSFPIIFPDLAIGYHFTKTDAIAAFSYRPINQKRSAFGFDQEMNRKSVIFETYKFIGDYHGFVPYVGLGFSYENLKLRETDNETLVSQLKENKFSPALVFGWDIRPSAKGDWWILRTNLRYYPFLKVEHLQKNLSLQHIEFNFIQLVVYPQRLKMNKI